MSYEVFDGDGRTVSLGDTVTDFRGDAATFVKVCRGVEYNGTAKVLVRFHDGWEQEYYAQVFDLTVTTLEDN